MTSTDMLQIINESGKASGGEDPQLASELLVAMYSAMVSR